MQEILPPEQTLLIEASIATSENLNTIF